MHARLRDDWPLLACVAAVHAAVFIVATKIWFSPPVIWPNTALQLSLLSSSASRATAAPERKARSTRPPVPMKTAASSSVQEPAPAMSATTSGAADDSSAEMTPASFEVAYLRNPKPLYPSMARRLGEQGQVLLRVQVTAEGAAAAVAVQASSGSSRLDQAALGAVRQWRFVAAQQGGRAIASTIIVPIVFHLEK